MSSQYSRIPNPQHERGLSEMEAAFDDSDDEGSLDSNEDSQVLRPLVSQEPIQPTTPARYDFNRVDYDYPPPGSPPGPSSLALPANAVYGNTNGLIPSETVQAPARQPKPNRTWISKYLPWIRSAYSRPNVGRVGGGAENDGVFANLTSKPSRARRIEDADGVHFVPEETQADAPPSYAAAQADAVPSYWETTIHAPAGGDVSGELIVDSLPTGSLFSFLWSMLVSVAFNFLGFVLTYLLHTTHAAKFGSRAGLGITLIQYGWALRTRAENGYEDGFSTDDVTKPIPTHSASNAAEAEMWREQFGNSTAVDGNYPFNGTFMLGESAAAWLSFFLMTIGWFLFLSSVLGFWRVKRWERGILHASAPSEQVVREESAEHELPISFTFPGLFFREDNGSTTRRHEGDDGDGTGERYVVQEIDRQRQIAEVRLNDARLQRNLRAAGLI